MDTGLIIIMVAGSSIAGLLGAIVSVWADKYIKKHKIG